jgi:DeoR family transcriptional regulator, fructose operon transcriptional repressor
MIGPQRRQTILETLRQNGAVSITDLVQALGVSAMTVRRDLDELERRNLLRRTYGGAIAAGSATTDPSFQHRAQVQQPAKLAIARCAAELIMPGERLILDSGSTVAAMCPFLGEKADVTVISNSLPVMHGLADHPDISLICTGGLFDPSINAFGGPLAERVLEDVRVDRAFVGATSISLEDGFSNSNLYSLSLQRIMLRVARESYLLVDSSKFNRAPFWLVAPVNTLTGIITDTAAPAATSERLGQAGLRVLLVEQG